MSVETTTPRIPRGAQVVCATLGTVLLAVGVMGLISRGVDGFGDLTGRTVLGLGGSPLLNSAHVVAGLVALVLARRALGAEIAGLVGGLTFLGFTVYDSVALINGAPGDPLSIQWPGLVLHSAALAASVLMVVLAGRAVGDRPVAARY
ncbi:DUF4383 domain-containing protein [Actinokineospora pegani]|uniref:DUF4383 domain-containing protein n=1 Tax=Actinokineospora pegani TaxID=2654637 RepID=UPI0012EA1376|nr:DUF4383 domain-containing protein [Actinokineospora pegani]